MQKPKTMHNFIISRKLILGLAITIAFAGAFAVGYSIGNQAPAGRIDAVTANSYFKKYYRTATSVSAPLKGFSIDMAQFDAMGQIIQQAHGVRSFRVYFGHDENNSRLGMVVGVDQAGTELSSMILSTSAGTLESCPLVCDEASLITQQ